MAFREQTALINTGSEKIIRIPTSAFSNPLAPSDIEVKAWATSYINPIDLRESILVYHSLDGSDSNYKYVWYVIRSTTDPVDIARVKDAVPDTDNIKVNHTQLIYNPSNTGNINNLNEVVESQEGQHWLIDIHGAAVNLNKSKGDYEVTDPTKGYVFTDVDGRRWRTTILTDGSHLTTEII